jgi:hypothetical protein
MDEDRNWSRIMWGVLLILLGTLLLLERIGLLPEWAWHFRWWALIVVVIGLGMLIQPRHAERVGSGVTFILLGAWFLLVSNDHFGLTWRNSWPLALVAAGAGTIARSVAARWLPDKRCLPKEERHA